MDITKERFDLLYRIYMAAKKQSRINMFTGLETAIEALKDYEVKTVADQLMNGENNRECYSTVENVGVQHE